MSVFKQIQILEEEILDQAFKYLNKIHCSIKDISDLRVIKQSYSLHGKFIYKLGIVDIRNNNYDLPFRVYSNDYLVGLKELLALYCEGNHEKR